MNQGTDAAQNLSLSCQYGSPALHTTWFLMSLVAPRCRKYTSVGGVKTPNINKLFQDQLGRGTVELRLQLMSRSYCWEVAWMICSLPPQAKGNGIPISYTLGNRTNRNLFFLPFFSINTTATVPGGQECAPPSGESSGA